MRGLKIDRGASVVIRGHAFIQNLRRGHYEPGGEARSRHLRTAAAFVHFVQETHPETIGTELSKWHAAL